MNHIDELNLPNVLLIGSMKSGTTGLFFDLAQHPDFFEPLDKEVNSLCSDRVLSKAGKQEYSSYYSRSTTGQIICDASTAYSKRPDYDGIAARAAKVLGDNVKILYIVRDPIDRIESQYNHERALGLTQYDINQEIIENNRYVNYSRYYYQMEPWIEYFGEQAIRIVKFENYVVNREAVVRELWTFLGLDECKVGEFRNLRKVVNSGDNKPILNNFWRQFKDSQFYQSFRPLLSIEIRRRIRYMILPRVSKLESSLSEDSKKYILQHKSTDMQKIAKIPGCSDLNWRY